MAQEWISTEKMPMAYLPVLVLTTEGDIKIAVAHPLGDHVVWNGEGVFCPYSEVTHWMPIPEPPKE